MKPACFFIFLGVFLILGYPLIPNSPRGAILGLVERESFKEAKTISSDAFSAECINIFKK